jgi:hypothetical protein
LNDSSYNGCTKRRITFDLQPSKAKVHSFKNDGPLKHHVFRD